MNGYLENGTWFNWRDQPIREATRMERTRAWWADRKRRRTYRNLAHHLIAKKRREA